MDLSPVVKIVLQNLSATKGKPLFFSSSWLLLDELPSCEEELFCEESFPLELEEFPEELEFEFELLLLLFPPEAPPLFPEPLF